MYVDSCLCLRVQKTKLIVSQAITLNGISHEDAVCSIYSVLVTSPPVVLSAVVNNRLVEAYAAEPETRRLLQEMLAITTDERLPQPAIYPNCLVDGHGRSPSPQQLLEALDSADRYMTGSTPEDRRLAFGIDSFHKPVPARNTDKNLYAKRKYLSNKKGISSARQQNFRTFSSALRKRLSVVRAEVVDKPLRCPLVEIGYTHKSAKRLQEHREHREHRSSNYIMNLVEAILGVLHPSVFQLKQFVIFLCESSEQASVGGHETPIKDLADAVR